MKPSCYDLKFVLETLFNIIKKMSLIRRCRKTWNFIKLIVTGEKTKFILFQSLEKEIKNFGLESETALKFIND